MRSESAMLCNAPDIWSYGSRPFRVIGLFRVMSVPKCFFFNQILYTTPRDFFFISDTINPHSFSCSFDRESAHRRCQRDSNWCISEQYSHHSRRCLVQSVQSNQPNSYIVARDSSPLKLRGSRFFLVSASSCHSWSSHSDLTVDEWHHQFILWHFL